MNEQDNNTQLVPENALQVDDVLDSSEQSGLSISELLNLLHKDGIVINSLKTLEETYEKLISIDDEETLDNICERICSGQIQGDADDFHNVAVEYSRKNRPADAVKICCAGKKKWPDDIDLYADEITYASDAADTESVNRAVKELIEHFPNKKVWNWRAFTFMFDYFLKYRPVNYLKNAKQLVADYKKYLPHEEKANMAEAKLCERQGDYEGITTTLEDAVKNKAAPQCALRLTDYYFERAKYEDALRTATLGIAFAAEPQPGIRTAYLLLIRALCKDALYLKENKDDKAEAERIIKEYQLVKQFPAVRPRERAVVEDRIKILSTYAGIDIQ